jgi:hypothetical protein
MPRLARDLRRRVSPRPPAKPLRTLPHTSLAPSSLGSRQICVWWPIPVDLSTPRNGGDLRSPPPPLPHVLVCPRHPATPWCHGSPLSKVRRRPPPPSTEAPLAGPSPSHAGEAVPVHCCLPFASCLLLPSPPPDLLPPWPLLLRLLISYSLPSNRRPHFHRCSGCQRKGLHLHLLNTEHHVSSNNLMRRQAKSTRLQTTAAGERVLLCGTRASEDVPSSSLGAKAQISTA